ASVSADNYVDKKVVPNVFPNSPQQTLSVEYEESGAKEGNELTPTQVHYTPRVKWEADEGLLYTLMMTDPDAPLVSEFLHWLVVNVRGSDLSTGKVVASYMGAGPPEGHGHHRYIFTVWNQTRSLTPEDYVVPGETASATSLVGRLMFKTVDYARKITGDPNPTPVAGNFFVAAYDDYVKTLQRHFEMLMRQINEE
ncbi:hypothetical protein PENTCL1PPCAC_27120, partial [Pristionchus entomophagus]